MCKKWVLSALIVLLAASVPLKVGQAANGRPGSGEFAYGAHLSMEGLLIEPALEAARNLPLDWVSVDFNWSKHARGLDSPPDLTALDSIITFATDQNLNIMLSIRAAPVWAQTSQGPDPQRTAQFISFLLERYPDTLAAFELFPAANTYEGWGASPNPEAYISMLAEVQSQLEKVNRPALLVTGSLRPISSNAVGNDQNDLSYLQSLYDFGLLGITDIVGLQLYDLTGDPLYVDGQEYRILRHYEQVRQVMVANNHQSGLIWVTQLRPPSGTINVADQRYHDPQTQVDWLTQAYSLLRAQLYIGAAFYSSLNPDLGKSNQGSSIIVDSNHYHLFYLKLRDLIAENSPEAALSRRGRSKEGELIKNRN